MRACQIVLEFGSSLLTMITCKVWKQSAYNDYMLICRFQAFFGRELYGATQREASGRAVTRCTYDGLRPVCGEEARSPPGRCRPGDDPHPRRRSPGIHAEGDHPA